MTKRTALFPGTYDPITLGHVDVVEKALKVFDELVIGIGHNTSKNHLFSHSQRTEMIEAVFAKHDNIRILSFTGLTVDLCRKESINFIVRGLRNTTDFDYEQAILEMNQKLLPGLETILLTTQPKYSTISSSIVREIIKSGGDVSQFVPKEIVPFLAK